MRELKFRAWTGKKFIGPVTFPFPTGYSGNLDFRMLSTYDWSQYTGLKDKNGKPIYEGDIVTFERPTNKGQVVFREASFQVAWHNKTFSKLSGAHDTEMEVIGNIYENKELLK